MKFYNYSREESINHTIKVYKEYLENMAPETGHDEVLDKVCTRHSLFEQCFPAELNNRIEELATSMGKELKVGKDSQGLTEKLDISQGIKTKELLEKILSTLTGNMDDGLQIETCLKGFLRRFEVFGKIHHEYAGNFKKGLGGYSDIHNYVLLAVNLLIYEGFRDNLKVLNAVLKLNDLLEGLIGEIKSPELFPLLLFSFTTEQNEIKRLYDSKGFGLPAGQ